MTATITSAPSFTSAVYAIKGDRRTKAYKDAVERASRPAVRLMRAVASESGQNLGTVQNVVMSAV